MPSAPPQHRPIPNAPTHSVKSTFYSSRPWRANRARFLAANPVCVECLKHNRFTAAEEVDHIVPITEGGEPMAWSNLQALCKSDHSAKTRKQNPRGGGLEV